MNEVRGRSSVRARRKSRLLFSIRVGVLKIMRSTDQSVHVLYTPMSTSSHLPYLQAFVRETLTPLFRLPATSYPLHDTSIYQQLAHLTSQWRTHRPTSKHTTSDEDTTHKGQPVTHLGAQLHAPSKVHVLHVLWDGHCTQSEPHTMLWKQLTANADKVWYDDLVQHMTRVNNPLHDGNALVDTYHWLHSYAHQTLRLLGEHEMCTQLLTMDDPLVRWCCEQWLTYPDLYNYFVPLDVQHAYEQRAACVQTIEWTWQSNDDASSTPSVYTLRTHVPNISLHPHLVNDLMYRITLMALLDTHRCRHVTLQWFPMDRPKWIGRVPINKSEGTTRGTRRRRPRSRTTLTLTHGAPPESPRGGCNNRTDPQLPLCVTGMTHSKGCASALPSCTAFPPMWNPYQINTGATMRNTCNTVTLWRREEAPKTFLHEMMHGFSWDFEPPQEMVHEWATTRFRIDPTTEIRFYEGYVETWATLLNCCFVHLKRVHTAAGESPTSLQQLVDDERRFAVFQAAKVVAHSGFARWSDFCVPTTSNARTASVEPYFRQTTSAFSYYIVRALHLWDMGWFLRNFGRIDYKSNPVTHKATWYRDWLAHLETLATSRPFACAVDACMKRLRHTHRPIDPRLMGTMRMTCVE